MKAIYKIISQIVLLSMVLVIAKPVLSQVIENFTANKPQYTTSTTPCSGRTIPVASCPSSISFTLAQEEFAVEAYLFILASILYFVVATTKYKSPIFTLFKPPILTQ